MRLLHQDPSTGLLKLRLETPSDLWRIARLVRTGDLVAASTTRRDPEAPEGTPGAQRDRRRVWLTVRAERVEFHGFSRHARVAGPIVEGPFDLGQHHTLDMAVGDEVNLTKQSLDATERAVLEEGIHHKGEPIVLIAAVDWGESIVVRVQGRSVESVGEVNRTISGKQFGGRGSERDRKEYAHELVELVVAHSADASAVLVAGPGFLKEAIAKAIAEAAPQLRSKVKIYSTSAAGRVGVDELLRSGKASEALAGSVAAEEAKAVEELATALAMSRGAIGLKEVERAVSSGAAETVLLSDRLVRDPSAASVAEQARRGRTRLIIVRSEGDAGRRLEALGGAGALLRYTWVPEATVRGKGGETAKG